MAERVIDGSRLKGGFVLRAHEVVEVGDRTLEFLRTFWIRSRSKEVNLLDRVLKCEDIRLRVYQFPVVDILEGKHGSLTFDGVYAPSELGLVDPRRLRATTDQ